MYYRTKDLGRGIGMIIFIVFIFLYFLFKLIKAYPIYFITGAIVATLIVLWFLYRRKKRKKEEFSKSVEALKQYKTAPLVKKERRAYPYDYNNIYYKKRRFAKQSGTERILKKAFDRAGLNIIPQYKISEMTVDFAIPEIMWVIEVDGPHHKQEEYKSQDKRRDYILKKMGWNIWRVKVGEIDNNVGEVVTKILRRLKRNKKRS